MRTNWRHGVMAAAALAVVGCAQERDPVNRVQPNAMPKAFFVGEDLNTITDDPEFYMRGTVIDVGYGASQDGLFTSTYAQPVTRIKWEVTEKFLNARLAYERVEGTDSKGKTVDGLRKKTSNDGQIVASYEIQSHFDISRQYNETTGEELNVIVENDSDRPWYERSHVRVDWSMNHVTDAYDFDTLSQMGLYGGVEYEPLAFTVLDPNDEQAPHLDMDKGYFDVTNKAFAKPQMIDLSHLGWGIEKFPSCMLPAEFAGGTQPVANCNPVELTVRQSFKKIAPSDYAPVDFDGVRFQAYGIFNFNVRMGYERNYGLVDDKWFRFASRYNLWQRSHYYSDPAKMKGAVKCASHETTVEPTGNPNADPNRDEDRNGTADECQAVYNATGVGGSKCDVILGKCTLPFAKRKAVTIPWYIGGGTDEDFFEATNWATLEWDLALKTAIQTARLTECRATGGGECDRRFGMWTGQQDDIDDAVNIAREQDKCHRNHGWGSSHCKQLVEEAVAALASERGDPNDPNAAAIGRILNKAPVIVLCHNPVKDSDHPSCGDAGLKTRLGDLRYNSVLVVDKPQTPSPWGIMVDADDPITGEKVASSINVWSHVTDLAAQGVVDQVRYMNGELATHEITDGEYIRNWAEASRVGAAGRSPTMTKAQIVERLASSSTLNPQQFARKLQQGLAPEIKYQLQPAYHEALDTAVRAGVPSPNRAMVAARLNSARGSSMEAELMNAPMLQRAGLPGDLPVEGPLADIASPLALNNPQVASRLYQMRENALAKRGACILQEAPEPSGLTGLADILLKKFPVAENESGADQRDRHESMFRYVRRRLHYAVIAHEMGHSIGHRHNFVSSSAPLFYRPQYWQLRTKNGAVQAPCLDAVDNGSSCVGPRYFDPVTEEEQSQMIWMFMQSSVMDYPGDISQDFIGLGAYDFAATRMFYGDNVSVYADASIRAGSPKGIALTNATDTFGGLAGIKYSKIGPQGLEQMHYSQLQNEYGVIGNCYDVNPQQPSWWDESKDGIWDPLLDGKIVSVDGAYRKCRQMPVDYVPWTELRMPQGSETGGGFYPGGPSIDRTSRLRVPYGFATDHWADLGNSSVYRHDNGADAYETAQFLINTQENKHIFENFRRNRTTFSVRSASDRSFSRYNEKLLGIASGVGFMSNIYKNFATNQGFSYESLWPYIVDAQVRDNMIAATVIFDHFARQLSRPEDGEHYALNRAFQDPVLRSSKDADSNPGQTEVIIPNGSTGYLHDVGFGGHPLENALSSDHGDFDTEYTINAGSYYQKIHTAILLSESEDRFVSQSRGDFYDARGRAAGIADVLPEGYRRILANALTGDRSMLAPHLVANASGRPMLDQNEIQSKYPSRPMGWTSWWPKEGPKTCFAKDGRNVCAPWGKFSGDLDPDEPQHTATVDPEIGWEVQKFLIAWTLAYIPANQRTNWIDMMRLYRAGLNVAPEFEHRVEWQDPQSGEIYYARSFGQECLFGTGADCDGGVMAERGIAARILQYANSLTAKGYKLDKDMYPPFGYNDYGRAMVLLHPDGTPIVRSDPALATIASNGGMGPPAPECDQNLDPSCDQLSIYENHWAYQLSGYKSIPDYLWEVLIRYRLASASQLGLFGD